jgi:hypothetical protein
LVDVDNGFEIPVSTNELVKDSFPTSDKKRIDTSPKPVLEVPPIASTFNFGYFNQAKDKLFICFEATDNTNVTQSDLIVRLINTTSYFLLLNCFSANTADFVWKMNAIVEPESTVELFRLKREKINECREIRLEILWFKKQKFEFQKPLLLNVKVKQDKLFLEKNFAESTFSKAKSYLQEIYVWPVPLTIPEDELRKHFEKSVIPKNDKQVVALFKQQQRRIEEREIDLHIEELVENFSGLSNAQIVQIQVNNFMKNLDEAISLRLKKLIVIHGKGNGRLKAEVYRALENYPKLKAQDASFAKYGTGATEILI